jgi:uncharacterized membrane protein
MKTSPIKKLRKYLLTGLIIWAPLSVTLWVLNLLIGMLDSVLVLLPQAWHTESWLGMHIPGLGVMFSLLLLFLTGLATHNFLGKRIISLSEKILHKIPIVGSIYSSVKQVSDTILSDSGNAFKKALLVRYPNTQSWTIGFQTSLPPKSIEPLLDADDYIGVYISTTPNPTSGFFILVRKSETIELDMSVDSALKYVVSMGVAAPKNLENNKS